MDLRESSSHYCLLTPHEKAAYRRKGVFNTNLKGIAYEPYEHMNLKHMNL